ncbi:MAG: hypothetical protein Q8P78_00745 [bacterium]|nr:hypothetical protein [bacterium]
MQEFDEQPKEAEGHAIVHEPRYWLITALAIVVTALLVGGGMRWWMNGKLEAQRKELEQKAAELRIQTEEKDESDAIETETDVDEVSAADWKTYQSAEFGFSFSYPSGWYAYQASELGSAYRAYEPAVLLTPRENLVVPQGTEWAAIGEHIWVKRQMLPEGTSSEEWAEEQENGEFVDEDGMPDDGARVFYIGLNNDRVLTTGEYYVLYYVFNGNEMLEFTGFSSGRGLLLEIIKTVRFAN